MGYSLPLQCGMVSTLYSNITYKRSDVINIARNYVAGVSLAGNRIVFLLPLNRQFASGLESNTITSATFSTLDVHSSGNSVAYVSHITEATGWVRKNGIDMQLTFDSLPSWLPIGSVCIVDARGNITL